MAVSIHFCGAAGTVTGSCYRVVHSRGEFLVDCGLFQGSKTLRSLNYSDFAFAPRRVDFVLLTHAHIDHSGLLPKLCRRGFEGPVLTTAGSRDLLAWLLPDSGYIQEAEVEALNRRNAHRGRAPVVPIYTRADAVACLGRIREVPRDEWIEAAPGVRARFWNAGHILGSASIEVELEGAGEAGAPLRMVFSGDLGPRCATFHAPPEAPRGTDILVVEGTYGDAERPALSAAERREALRRDVAAGLAAGGNLLIPVFAVERTQELLADLVALFDAGALPPVRVFLDSPLAIKATEVFAAHADELNDGIAPGTTPFRRDNIHFIEDVEASKALGRVSNAIILAASGMCDAGRIRFHLRNNLWRGDCTLLLVGYQVAGTLGRLLESGVRTVRIMGEEIAVKARVRRLDIYSGHADRRALIDWVRARLPVRRALFITHGEETSLDGLRAGLAELGLDPRRLVVPRLGETVDLAPGKLRHHRPEPWLATATAAADWHNDYAAFLLAVRDELDGLADDRQRALLLRRLRRVLGEGRAGAPHAKTRELV